MNPSKNLIQELMDITGWSRKRVISSLQELKRYGLIESDGKGRLVLKEVV